MSDTTEMMEDHPINKAAWARGDAWEGQPETHNEPKASVTIAAKTDAAQAKTDAIANLTLKCYERASMLQLTEDETARLQADFPDEAFRPGAAGKESLIYIEHAFLRDRLHDTLGIGQWTIVPRRTWEEPFTTAKGQPGIRVYVEAMLIVRGCYVDEAIGDMDYYPQGQATNYGDAIKGAKTQALRRCCADGLGVGLQAWKKGWCEQWWSRHRMGNQPERIQDAVNLPMCPKCGSTTSVIIGKPEYGGGYVCFEKKGGCKHKWSTDTPARRNEPNGIDPILAEWDALLDPLTVNADKLNGEIKTKFAKIGGKDPARAKVWAKIIKFAEAHGYYSNHATKTFVPREQEAAL